MVIILEKYQYFNNIKFTRDEKTGYYLNSTLRKRIHRYVWEFYNGSIPKGYEVHHIDGNKANNDISNLALLSKKEHALLHGNNQSEKVLLRKRRNIIEKALPEAIKWHKSEQGKLWHKQHSLQIARNVKEKEYTCSNCGKTFYAKPFGKNKFCSNRCKSSYRRKLGLDNIEKKCEYCGGVFIANKYSKRKYCSKECSKSSKNNKTEE